MTNESPGAPHDCTPPLIVAPRLNGADGISVVTRLAVRALTAAGHAPEIWTLSEDEDSGLVEAPVSAAIESASGSRLRFLSQAVRRTVVSPRPSFVLVLHVQLLPVLAALSARSRLAVYLHGIEVWRRLSRPVRRMLRRADLLIAHSSFAARRFAEANPRVGLRAVAICPPGLPTAAVETASTPQPPRHSAMIVGRLVREERYKGHDTLIDIWPRVRAQVPEATLTIVGDGDDRARLESRVRAAGLQQAIAFTGKISHGELLHAYRRAGVFVMPSTGEGFGLVFLEAMREGVACIGAPGSASEIIDDGVSGYLVDPSTPEELSKRLIELLGDRGRSAAMGAAGRARFLAHFTEASYQARVLSALGSIGRC